MNYDTDRIKALKIEDTKKEIRELLSFNSEETKLIERLAENAVFYPEESERDYYDGYVSLWEKVSAINVLQKIFNEIQGSVIGE